MLWAREHLLSFWGATRSEGEGEGDGEREREIERHKTGNARGGRARHEGARGDGARERERRGKGLRLRKVYLRDNYSSESSAAGLNDYDHPDPYHQGHMVNQTPTRTMRSTEYGQRLGPSGRSLNDGHCSVPNLGDFGAPQYNTSREPYPA
ncbi:hypothetical protein BJV77DRAFT_964476 [Russula vinacea]|nr:hypothetical protein BJV77DRAFT_964476 [Russula vinacea]